MSTSNPPNQVGNPAAAIPVYQGQTPGGAVGAIVTGQVSVTGTQAQLPSHALTGAVTLSTPASNTGTIYIGLTGVTTSTGFALAPGASISLPIANTNLLYALGSHSGDVLTFIGT